MASLDSLSVDIARMIDHETAADLWERLQIARARNVFTRRLYTMQGRKAFDEVAQALQVRPRVPPDRRSVYRANSNGFSAKSGATTARRG